MFVVSFAQVGNSGFCRFKFKYHPEDSGKRKEDINAALKRRCQVFIDLLEQSRIDNVSLDVEKDEEIVKVLDAG